MVKIKRKISSYQYSVDKVRKKKKKKKKKKKVEKPSVVVCKNNCNAIRVEEFHWSHVKLVCSWIFHRFLNG